MHSCPERLSESAQIKKDERSLLLLGREQAVFRVIASLGTVIEVVRIFLFTGCLTVGSVHNAMQDSKTPRPGLLVSDFDDTLSASDTISVIFSLAVDARRQAEGEKSDILIAI